MHIETLTVGPLQVNCYVLACERTRQALVVDPGDEGERILAALRASGLDLQAIVNTHGHFDHIGGNRLLAEETGAPLMIHEGDLPLLRRSGEHASIFGLRTTPSPEPTRFLADDETLEIGDLQVRVLHTPGHSPGGICLLVDGHLFSGDTLFASSIGRTDLPGGNHATLVAGIRAKLLILPEETVVHPGHGPDSTIGREKQLNPFLT